MPDVVLIALIIIPLVITFLLKSNAAMAFLALCGGFALISYTDINIKDLTKNLSFQVNSSTFNLFLLATPFILTLLIRRKAFGSPIRKISQLICALCGGGLLALLAIPLLNESVRLNFVNNAGWTDLQKAQTPIVVIGLVVSLFLLWMPKKSKPEKKHK